MYCENQSIGVGDAESRHELRQAEATHIVSIEGMPHVTMAFCRPCAVWWQEIRVGTIEQIEPIGELFVVGDIVAVCSSQVIRPIAYKWHHRLGRITGLDIDDRWVIQMLDKGDVPLERFGAFGERQLRLVHRPEVAVVM